MAQAKAEVEYDRFKALTAAEPRPVDADFEAAVQELQTSPKLKATKRSKR